MQKYDGFIYKWANIENGKSYIGSHKGSIDDGYISSSKYFLKDYLENPQNFNREILEYIKGDIPHIRKIETQYLKKYDVSKDENFYNKSNTAFGCSMEGSSNPMYGVEYTDARKHKTKETWKKKIAEGYTPYNKGIPIQEEVKHKLCDLWEVIDKNGNKFIISNMSKFCQDNELNNSAISQVARGNRKHHKGFKCRKLTNNRKVDYEYKEWKSKGPPGGFNRFGKDNSFSKKVTINGKTYYSIKEACEKLDMSYYKLRKLLNDN